MKMRKLSLTFLGIAIAAAAPLDSFQVKREVSELRDAYDFVIAGGGTAGLTVADRLTEAFPNRKSLSFGFLNATAHLEPFRNTNGRPQGV
jgi:hypothetical protein